VLEDFRRLELFYHGRRRRYSSRLRQDKGHRAEWEAFVSSCRTDSDAPIPLEELVSTSLVSFRALESFFRSTLEAVGPSSSAGLKLLCGMAEEYLRLRRLVLAESIFAEATSYSPSYVRALLGLARVRLRYGDEVEAIEYYQKILQLDPENAPAKNELGNLIVQRRLRGRD
jgi:tetratricopeptide (TPR) repeat protein